MDPTLASLIQALREELQQFGEMLAGLDAPLAATESQSTQMQTQVALVRKVRRHRRECQRQAAVNLGLGAEAGIGEIVPVLPRDYRPLVLALDQENRALLKSVRERLGRDQSSMSRSLSVLDKLVAGLSPDALDAEPVADPAVMV